ncbi:hypothetical protein [Herbaspirillum sp. ST 5-3]|uniref:hypothetical protein n=1 Tax=Oxalobacteraceae TaxID=75682 RepID=UPI0010A2B621|nr:hypothetical protein [Herbaspirillum sp. ST 5-3]
MSERTDRHTHVLRMNVQVAREEHPDLYDELKKFGKGIKRIQRLKTLASERLLLAGSVRFVEAGRREAASPHTAYLAGEDEIAAVHELCLPPLK